jgi:hypothetical protein
VTTRQVNCRSNLGATCLMLVLLPFFILSL